MAPFRRRNASGLTGGNFTVKLQTRGQVEFTGIEKSEAMPFHAGGMTALCDAQSIGHVAVCDRAVGSARGPLGVAQQVSLGEGVGEGGAVPHRALALALPLHPQRAKQGQL